VRSGGMSDVELVRADPKRSVRFLIIAAIGALLLAAILWPIYLHFLDAMPQAGARLAPERSDELRFQLQLTFFGIFSALAAPFFLLIFHGVKALRRGVLPLPGALVFRDTRVLRGFAVTWRAYAAIAIGVGGASALLYGCWWMLNRIGR
jgi:hypothetical protein